jgi:TolB-like protein/class 3 adenylate cyclase/tetratricopeptide (TPR) repeat protein
MQLHDRLGRAVLERAQRRLTAILSADVVGYSRLIGQDETGTLRRLKELRRNVIDLSIGDHHGRVVKTTGDGILIEFPSAVEAVQCAVRVQHATATAEAKIPPDRRIAFRVGVHQGDVVVEDGDLFGDGVNVAARLEGLSEAGGVCISGRVYEDTVGRLDLPFEDRGEQQVKNIARPVRVYGLGSDAIAGLSPLPRTENAQGSTGSFRQLVTPFVGPSASSMRWAGVLLAALVAIGLVIWQSAEKGNFSWLASTRLTQTHPRGPTIAVLPFDNMSGDPSQEFFSDGLADELLTLLSHFDELRVLARNSTFAYKNKAVGTQELGRQLQAQYAIEGSFRRVPEQISVTAQLIDTRTGIHVWAQTYERPTGSTSLLAIQDDIAQQIAAAVGDIRTGAVAKAELERTHNLPATELSSYACLLQGYQASAAQSDSEAMRRARICLEATVQRDPGFAAAWAILTRVLSIERSWGTGLDDTEHGDDLIPRIVEAANRAAQLAPESAAAHFALFSAYEVNCQTERMRIEVDRILAINPGDASALGLLGNLLAYAGDWDYGRGLAEKAIALAGPAAPSWWWWVIAKDHYRKGEYAKALEVFRQSYVEQNWLDHLHLIYTLPYVNRLNDARAQIPVMLKLKPGMTVQEADRFYKTWCFDADFRQRITTALRLAGLRDE